MKLSPCRLSVLALVCALLPLLGARSEAGSPRFNHCYPSGGQRGTELEVSFSGSHLADARDLLFDEPGFTVTPVKAEDALFVVKLKIAPDAQLGEHRVRVITDSGVSDLHLFYVTPFPMVESKKDKDHPDAPQPVALNTTVYGHTPEAEQDHYLVELKKGQRLTAEVIGCRLQSQTPYDPIVRIAKEDGTLLTEVDDTTFSKMDPVAAILAPEDGKYVVTIKESTNSGVGKCHYLMHLGTFAQPLGVYPAGGPAGQEISAQLLGDVAGSVETKLQLPSSPDPQFEVFSQQDVPAPMPNQIRVSPFPNVLEVEPNDGISTATEAPALPIALNGVIEKKGDVDYFKIHPQKGQAYDITVYARQLRSPLDSVISIYNDKGGRIAENDDENAMPDSHLRWTAPAEGDFYLAITDQLKRGGPLFFYRIEIVPVAARISLYLPDMVLNSSQERRAIVVPQGNRYASLVRLRRSDVSGGAEFTSDGLPGGVQCTPALLSDSVDTIPVVFEAAPDAPVIAGGFVMNAKLNEKNSPNLASTVEHTVDIVENGNQKPFISVTEDKLPIAITKPLPVKLSLVQPKVPILRNGSMDLKVKAERTGDYKGPISLSLLYSPPGIGSGGSAQIAEGASEGNMTISCNDKAPLKTWKVCVVGSYDAGKGAVFFSTQLVDLEVGDFLVAGQVQRTFIDQGDATTITVKLDQKIPFEGKARITLEGLPQGISAQEKEITKDDQEVKFDVKAEPNATVGQHRALFCRLKLSRDGEEMTNTFGMGGILRVDKASSAPKTEPAK